jgi:hypothetical protein
MTSSPRQPLNHHAARRDSRRWLGIKHLAACLVFAALFWPQRLPAEPVAVRNIEGVVHGFVVLRTLNETLLADGDVTQTVRGDQVTGRLVFHFRDGSIHDDTTVYSQRQNFRLVSEHLVQKGPAFPRPLEMSIDGATGKVTVRYTNGRGEQKVEAAQFDAPDLANGMVLTLLKNVRPDAPPKTMSLVGATPTPRLVKVAVVVAGEDRFLTGSLVRQATHYILKVQIGGVAGMLAPLVGMQPPDSHVWILDGEAPAFVMAEEALFVGGPLWRIELVSPVRPRTLASRR